MKKYILLLLLFSFAVYADIDKRFPEGKTISLDVKNKHTKVIVDCIYGFWTPDQRQYYLDETQKDDYSESLVMYKTALKYCARSKWGSYKDMPKEDGEMLALFVSAKILTTPVVAKKEQIDRLAQCMVDQSTGVDMIYLIQYIKGDKRYKEESLEYVREIISNLTFSCNAIDSSKWDKESNVNLMEKFYEIILKGYR